MIQSRRRRLECLWEALCGFLILPRPYFPRKYRPQFKSSVPVISVGNITLGGTGKTPFVIWLLDKLREYRLAVLHSGYGGGDEAHMIKAKFPEIFVWNHAYRHLGLEAAEAFGAELIILDDGFQCRRIHRDLDIAVLDMSTPWERENLLPFGRLRESPKALSRADLIISNHGSHTELIRRYSQAPILHMKPILEPVPPKPSGVFCGLGNPKHFMALLEAQKIPIRTLLLLADHEKPRQKLWKTWMQDCEKQQVEQILCTEKDFYASTLELKPSVIPGLTRDPWIPHQVRNDSTVIEIIPIKMDLVLA